MKQDEIIEMARQAGLYQDINVSFHQALKNFYNLATAKEREACAKMVGEFAQKWWSIHCDSNKHMETTRKAHDDFCALQVAIRARGEA
jgi:hypothetical protein